MRKMSLLASVNYGALKKDQRFVFSKMQRSICREKSRWLGQWRMFWSVVWIYLFVRPIKAGLFLHPKQFPQLYFHSPVSIDLVSLATTLSSWFSQQYSDLSVHPQSFPAWLSSTLQHEYSMILSSLWRCEESGGENDNVIFQVQNTYNT